MRPQTGLTFLELLIGVALVGVLAGLAVPAFHGVIERARVDTVANQMHATLSLARSKAVFRRSHIAICRTRDHQVCLYSGPWSMGTMTFEDRNRNHVRDRDEKILAVQRESEFQGLHLVGGTRRPVISFRPDGRSAGTNLTLRICARSLEVRRLLIMNVGGRVRLSHPGPNAGRCGTDQTP